MFVRTIRQADCFSTHIAAVLAEHIVFYVLGGSALSRLAVSVRISRIAPCGRYPLLAPMLFIGSMFGLSSLKHFARQNVRANNSRRELF